MPTNFEAGRSAAKQDNYKPQQSKSLAAKAPALDTLSIQLDSQIESLEAQTRDLVRQKMHVEARDRVRGAVVDELTEVATQPDFFDFSEMFDTIEAPAIEVVDG